MSGLLFGCHSRRESASALTVVKTIVIGSAEMTILFLKKAVRRLHPSVVPMLECDDRAVRGAGALRI